MKWWSFLFEEGSPKPETRSASLENPAIGLDDARAWSSLFGSISSHTGETVSVEAAMSIPAFWAGVDAIASAIASLPLHVFRRGPEGREKVAENDPLQRLLRDQVNPDYLTSADWRRYVVTQYLTRGRSLTFIERNKAGRVTALWPLDVDQVDIRLKGQRRQYVERSTGNTYDASEIIDLIWMPGGTIGSHLDPISVHRNTFGAIIAADKFAARAYRNGGISPLKLKVPQSMSPAAAEKAVQGVSHALANGGMVLPLFGDMDLDDIGFDPEKMSLIDLKRFQVEEVARILRIQPSKIQDNTRSTYTNSEQQGLAFVKDTIAPIVEQLEAELLAKLFSDKNRTHFVKLNLDGLIRGDIATRYTAFARAIQGGFLTPNEARSLDDREPLPGGDDLLIQGATVKMADADTQSPTMPDPGEEQNEH